MKTFVVSLADEQERRNHVRELVAQYQLDAEFIDAVDLRKVDDKVAYQFYQPTERALRKNKLLNRPEVGCALSHQNIYKRMIDEQIPIALVLEDDVQFLTSPKEVLDNYEQQALAGQSPLSFDVLILGYVKVTLEQLPYYYRKTPIKKREQMGKYWLGTPWEQYGCGTVAYIVTLEGARKMRQATGKISVTADNWSHFEEHNQLRVWHLRPSVAIEASERFDSTIRVEPENFLKPSWDSVLIRSTKGIIKDFLMNKMGLK